MIVFSLSLQVSPSGRADFLQGVGRLLEPTRVVPGCLGCQLYMDAENLDAFLLIEQWASQSELDRYLGSDACKTLVALMEMSLRHPLIRFDDVSRSGGIEVIESARRARGRLHEPPKSHRKRRHET